MIRGQKRPLKSEVALINKEAKLSIHNRFDVEVIDSKTGEVKQKAYAVNIVLNSLWARMFLPNKYFNYIHFGIGTGTPDPARTELFVFIGQKACSQDPTVACDYESGYFSFRKNIQLSEAEYVGATLTEVGIGIGSGSNTLATHALLRDMNGNIISIQKSNTDIVNIYATVYVHWNPEGFGYGGINFVNVDSDFDTSIRLDYIRLFLYLSGCYTTPPSNLSFFTGDHARNSNTVSGTYYNNPTLVNNKTVSYTYDLPNKKISSGTVRLTVANGNTQFGIRSIGLTTNVSNGMSGIPFLYFTLDKVISIPPIIGEAVGTGDGSEVMFATKFPLVKTDPLPKIYVDGVEQTTGVVVACGKPNHKDIGRYMKVLKLIARSTYSGSSFFTLPGQRLDLGNSNRAGEICLCENPFFEEGIDNYRSAGCIVYVSQDMESWTQISASNFAESGNYYITSHTVPAAYKNYKFWKIESRNISEGWFYHNTLQEINCNAFDNFKNIVFDTPPPAGAVITADYSTEVLPKDENHVFDFSFEITLGEKTV